MHKVTKRKFFILTISILLVILVFTKIYVYDGGWQAQNIPLRNVEALNHKSMIGLEEHDESLILDLKKEVIVEPSKKDYNLEHPEKKDFSQYKQGIFLHDYFKNKKNGTFIEAGAYDGETFSNTLILERELGWTGLLIEPNALYYKSIPLKNRKAQHARCCLSLSPISSNMTLSNKGMGSRLVANTNETKGVARVTCYPLFSLIVAANLTTLDLLSLDLESVEVKVLKTIPWDEVDIKSILVEVNHIPEGKNFLTKYMKQNNYKLYKKLHIDYFFVKQYVN
ncbi:UNVERIFIED_CONTAM: hypothetical protein RMT77_012631 [Armadillidium vulgare]